jgi:hypothetical protein
MGSPIKTAAPRSLYLIILVAHLSVFAGPRAFGAEWYVDAAAAGSIHDGRSWVNAWKSLATIQQTSLSGGDVVWVKSGFYNERFVLSSGGLDGRRINYVGTGPTRPVVRGFDGGSFSNIGVINFEITQESEADAFDAIYLRGASGWLIEDNYIHDTYGSGILTAYKTINSFIIVRHNTFSDIGSVGAGSSTPVVMSLAGDHNLIEYNSVRHSMDRCRAFGLGIVIRNNYWGPTDSNLYPNSKPYPNHTDGFQSWEGGPPLIQLLFERNFDIDNLDSAGGTNGHGFLVQDAAGIFGFNWYILRFNILVRPGGGAYSFQNVAQTYVYNSTFIGIQYGAKRPYQTAAAYTYPSTHSAASSDFADARNNTWDFCPNCRDPRGVISSAYWPRHFTSAAQHSFNFGAQVVLPSGAQPANLPHSNPLFTDGTGFRGHDDYSLQSASPLIGAGAPITTAMCEGKFSTKLYVADAKRIFDGWGIAEGDVIKVGTGDYVRVASVDYDSNHVILCAARSWSNGDPVFVKGSEDVGALPFAFALPVQVSNTTHRTLAAGKARLTAQSANGSAIRKVEFLVDGVPVGETTDSPYSIEWQSDGNRHSVEARAYNAWASPILSASDTATINSR